MFVSDAESFTVADIPGLIEGAHLGHGLGVRFLRHLSRTRVLVFVIDLSGEPRRDFDTVRGEIEAFDPLTLKRPSLVALNKLDLVTVAQATLATRAMRRHTGMEVFAISAHRREGLAPLTAAIAQHLHAIDRPA